MNKKKFLVIGSNSFSGSHFVNGLLDNNQIVHGISRSNEAEKVFLPYLWKDEIGSEFRKKKDNFHFKQLNINTQLNDLIELIKNIKPEYIVNFAAQGMVAESWKSPTNWYQTNTLSQVAFHDELRKLKFLKKYVHVSTPEVYGSTDKGWIKESEIYSPSTPYAVSRAACDLHLKSFFEAYDFPVVFTRAANVYGPGQQLYRIIPRTILSVLSGKKLKLHGAGISERSFIHINDVVQATMKIAIDADPGTIWHLSTKEAIKIKDLVSMICTMNKVQFESIVEIEKERVGKDLSYLLDSSKARSELGWEDSIDLNTGLRQTFEWVEANFAKLEKLPWNYIHKS